MISKSSVDFADAARMLAACLERARATGASVSIAVVDDAGKLLQFARMDGARGFTVDFAIRKAAAAAAVGVSTKIITEMSRASPGPASEAAVGAGGLPVLVGGQCAGAIGVSGARPDVDEEIAAAGVAVLS